MYFGEMPDAKVPQTWEELEKLAALVRIEREDTAAQYQYIRDTFGEDAAFEWMDNRCDHYPDRLGKAVEQGFAQLVYKEINKVLDNLGSDAINAMKVVKDVHPAYLEFGTSGAVRIALVEWAKQHQLIDEGSHLEDRIPCDRKYYGMDKGEKQ